ncbi:MAG: glucuronate isomerase [Oscillospiraceae bacterium]|nr:glucuronate isomerase [Oscillospiraceae bacterium]
MKPFMNEDFLLDSKTAQTLYHGYAAQMPINDYHCHVSPKEIALDISLENITKAWLGGDHYKWRIIRSRGVDENDITGSASDRVKFQKFAEALPYAIGNPIYHWTHLELKRFFDCDLVLNPQSADAVWELCNKRLAQDSMSVRNIIRKSNVNHIGTTDDPIDSLEWHRQMKADPSWDVNVIPTFRPDKAMNIEKPGYADYIEKLSKAAGMAINKIDDLYAALVNRLDYFAAVGCVISDHALDYMMWADGCEQMAGGIFEKVMKGEVPAKHEVEAFKAAVMVFLAGQYAKRNWVMQIHYGASRNINSAMFEKLGPDTGFDGISGHECSAAAYKLLDAMSKGGSLPKTVLYSLNPNDDAYLAATLSAFQSCGMPGKIQHGSGWWFNDTKTGMISQMTNLANQNVLGNFIGMLTDSRSFLSYTRHEYFRRILCNLIGGWVENGEYPNDVDFLGQMVKDISYNNSVRFLGFDK